MWLYEIIYSKESLELVNIIISVITYYILMMRCLTDMWDQCVEHNNKKLKIINNTSSKYFFFLLRYRS